jgi:hypothetical protein
VWGAWGKWPRAVGRASGGAGAVPDPFLALGATYAWRAQDATGTVQTDTLPSYIGALNLARTGAGQALKATTANWPRQPVQVTFASGLGGYSGALAVPAAYTFASVVRPTANSSAIHDWNVALGVNTGSCTGAMGVGNSGFAQKLVTAALQALSAPPVNVLLVGRFDAAGCVVNANAATGVSVALAGALAGDTVVIGGLGNGNTFPMKGEWLTSGLWTRYLSDAEVAQWLALASVRYGVAVAP